MTTEHRALIDLDDLHRLRLDCSTCGAALTVDLREFEPNNLTATCPNCGLRWLDARAREFDALQSLIRALKLLRRDARAEMPNAKLSVRFETLEPPLADPLQ